MEVPDGSAVTLSASITGTAPAATYAWTPPVGAGVSDSGTATLAWTFNGATDAGTYSVTATDASAVDSPKSASLVLTPQQNAGDLWTSCVTTTVAGDTVFHFDAALGASGRSVVAWQFFPVGGNGTDVPVIQCFNPQGDVLWSRRIAVDTFSIQKIQCCIDDSNNAYLALFSDSSVCRVWAFGSTGTLLWTKSCSGSRFHAWSYSYYDSALNRWILSGRDATSANKWFFTGFDLSNGSIAVSRELTVTGMTSNGFSSAAITKNAAGNYIVSLNGANFPDGQTGTLLIETDTNFASLTRQVRIPVGMSYPNVVTDASNNIYVATSNNRIIVLDSSFAHVKTVQYAGISTNGIRGLQKDLDNSIWAIVDADLLSIGYDASLIRFNSDCSQLLQRLSSRVSQFGGNSPIFAQSQWMNAVRGKFLRVSGNYNGTGTRGKLMVTCENLPLGKWRRRSANGISGTEFLDSLADDTSLVQSIDTPTSLISFSAATLGAAGITVADSGIGVIDGAGQFDRRRHTLQDNITFLMHCDSAGAGNGGVQAEDNSGQRITLTRHSTGADPGTCFISDAQSVFGGYSLRLNGTDSDAGHLQFGASGLSAAGGGLILPTNIPLTLEWRARHDTLASSQAYFGTTNRTGGIRLVSSTSLQVNAGGAVANYTLSSLSIDTWYAFALCAVGQSPWNLRLYVNGFFISEVPIFNTLDFSSGFIGRWAASGGTAYPMKGYMDEIRFIYGRALYTGASYTVATSPFVGFGD